MDLSTESDHAPGSAMSIKAIDRRSVHRICSGQVVLTLTTAVKELVENSLDAGATSIEVRLKDHGTELIEVLDNGAGVEEVNFAGLTLKHHTSKLREFGDLTYVETFGFRGEALSSLCALSHLSVVTCHKDASVGTRLEFNTNGHISSQAPCARQRGTTVSLGQLFHSLPVRHKEFNRNIKKEFVKMVHVLNAYCVISTGVRITCTNQTTSSGKKSIIISTNGNDSIKENITNIFGPKQCQSLLKFTQVLPTEQVCAEYNINVPTTAIFRVEGFVSSCEHGKGRGSSDRQFLFVNRRPCDLAKVSRLLNEVYHSYNRHQFPFAVLDISLAKESVDINVTPDKRQIFISEEKLLLATIKASLIQLFEPISSVYQVNQGQGKLTASLTSSFSQRFTEQTASPCLKKAVSSPSPSSKISLTSTLASLKRSFSSAFAKSEDGGELSCKSPLPPKPDKQRRLDNFILVENKSPAKGSPFGATLPESPASSGINTAPEVLLSESEEPLLTCDVTASGDDVAVACRDVATLRSSANTNLAAGTLSSSPVGMRRDSPDVTLSKHCSDEAEVSDERNPGGRFSPKEAEEESVCEEDQGNELREESEEPLISHPAVTEYDQAEEGERLRRSRTMSFSMSQLRRLLSLRQKAEQKTRDQFRSFRAQISPGDNQAAEEELKKEVKKDMFAKMEILGQFNLGFILAKLGSDLFIVDQHATDEKYNFEMLQQHTVIRSQKLIQPQKLELTAANSTILMDNIDIFKTNGFEFEVDEEAPVSERVKLTAMPVSKNWTFGKDDIEELIFMLSDTPGVLCRPSRVRMMFASRACRKSIMVGTALNNAEMRKVITHMGEIDQPWNCPHGRPTMRHLINLDCLQNL